MKPIILDLCGGSGAWSQPYADSGKYDVRIIDPWAYGPNVLDYHPPANVVGVLAAPPCTDFCRSGAQYWPAKDRDGRTDVSLAVVWACLRIVSECGSELRWWALENPVGRLKHYLWKPDFVFDPCEFGDPWTKKTCLWGNFRRPKPRPVKPVPGSHVTDKLSGSQWRERSKTPPGFARAFFLANK